MRCGAVGWVVVLLFWKQFAVKNSLSRYDPNATCSPLHVCASQDTLRHGNRATSAPDYAPRARPVRGSLPTCDRRTRP